MTNRDLREAAYEAVREGGILGSDATVNARIWRAVTVTLDAALPEPTVAGESEREALAGLLYGLAGGGASWGTDSVASIDAAFAFEDADVIRAAGFHRDHSERGVAGSRQ